MSIRPPCSFAFLFKIAFCILIVYQHFQKCRTFSNMQNAILKKNANEQGGLIDTKSPGHVYLVCILLEAWIAGIVNDAQAQKLCVFTSILLEMRLVYAFLFFLSPKAAPVGDK